MTDSPLIAAGVELPRLGFGVYRVEPGDTRAIVISALEAGYRLIDTAQVYDNAAEVAQAVAASGIPRDQIVVVSKLWIEGYERAQEAAAAAALQCQPDILLLHHPVPSRFDRTLAAYRALEALLARGDVRAIGVSNFGIPHLEALAARVDVMPAVNQIECHPFFAQAPLREWLSAHGVVCLAWSALGGVNTYWEGAGGTNGSPLEAPLILDIAMRLRRTPAQIILRWHFQHDVVSLAKTTQPERMRENLNIHNFTLGERDMLAIDALETGIRGGPDPELVH